MKSVARLLGSLSLLVFASCGPADFLPPNRLQGIRILASRADHPYAAPGQKVEVEVLAIDARPVQTVPMKVYWLPIPCVNPASDLYYACFTTFAKQLSGAGAGAGTGTGGGTGNIDVTALLSEGPKFSFTMPSDVITSHPVVAGSPIPYGLTILFNIACAGHVKTVPPVDGTLQSPPIGCFDDAGNVLGADQYVIGLTRVYAYDAVQNQNPPPGTIAFEGTAINLQEGIVVDECTEKDILNCHEWKLTATGVDGSQEENPLDLDQNGKPIREQIWASFFTTLGQFKNESELLFDTQSGKVSGNDNGFYAPNDLAINPVRSGRAYVVFHDSRGGASWVDFPVRVGASK